MFTCAISLSAITKVSIIASTGKTANSVGTETVDHITVIGIVILTLISICKITHL